MMKARKGSRGFTLMETLLAITLFLIVAVASTSVFTMGIRIWRRSQGDATLERRVLLVMERMGEELRESIRFRSAGKTKGLMQERMTYEGGAASIAIPAVLNTATGKAYGRIVYRLGPGSGEICRAEETFPDFFQKKIPVCRPVAKHVGRLKFRYWLPGLGNRYTWQEEWDGSAGLPAAVEITLQTAPETRGVLPRTYKKTVVIPTGMTA